MTPLLDKLGIHKGILKIRTKSDSTGDYTHTTYDIMEEFQWGANYITGEITNPYDARMFVLAPEMLEIILKNNLDYEDKFGVDNGQYTKIVTIALNMDWDEISYILRKKKVKNEY